MTYYIARDRRPGTSEFRTEAPGSPTLVFGLSDSIMRAGSRVATISKPHEIRSTAVTCDSVVPNFRSSMIIPAGRDSPALSIMRAVSRRAVILQTNMLFVNVWSIFAFSSRQKQLPSRKPSARAQPGGSGQVQSL